MSLIVLATWNHCLLMVPPHVGRVMVNQGLYVQAANGQMGHRKGLFIAPFM